MAALTQTFTTINGVLVHQFDSGTPTATSEVGYTSDPLGSLVECKLRTGAVSYEAEYWPYGEVQASSGTNLSPWGFVGLLGYVADTATLLYVRARYLTTKFARWLTVDPLWPYEAPYAYVRSRPVDGVDPSGLAWTIGPITIDPSMPKFWECLTLCLKIFLSFLGSLTLKCLVQGGMGWLCKLCLGTWFATCVTTPPLCLPLLQVCLRTCAKDLIRCLVASLGIALMALGACMTQCMLHFCTKWSFGGTAGSVNLSRSTLGSTA